MRKISLFLLLWLCLWRTSSSYAQQQWKWLNPQPTGSACLTVKFTDPQTGFILNYDGQLLKTTDQGGHWNLFSQFGIAPACMDIVDSIGVAGGYNGLLYVSSDNGTSWQQLNTGITDQFSYINIVSRDTFILGSNAVSGGVFYKTTDRGKTFTKSLLGEGISLNCMTFLDSKLGFAGSRNSAIFKTEDGGATWAELLSSPYGPSGIYALQFYNKDTGYAARENSDIMYTRDGGKTWKDTSLAGSISTIRVFGPRIAYAGGGEGMIYKTVDGGEHWSYLSPNNEVRYGNDIYGMSVVSENTCFAVGLLGRIMKTTDGGATWHMYSATDIPVTAVDFPTADTGYITTWNNIYKTTNKGNSWTLLPLAVGTVYPSAARFDRAHFVSADTGFVTASNPAKVYNTVDGGQTWTSQVASVGPVYPYDETSGFDFIDRKNGLMALQTTAFSAIVKTHDGGKTWSDVWKSPTTQDFFRKIFSPDGATAYAIHGYQVYKSTDSAKSWTLLNIYNYNGQMLSDLWFTDVNTGFVVQDDGKIYVTHDGGATWDLTWPLMNWVGEPGINVIKFFDRRIGYFAGGNDFGPSPFGCIFKTIDSGRTWQQVYNYGGSQIVFTPDSNVIITGYGGEVIKSAVANYQIDSVAATFINYPCTQKLTASAGVAYGRVDSLSFEVTSPSGVVQYIAASPASVVDSRVVCSALSDTSWTAGATYTARFRLYYKGEWKYSKPISFTAPGVPKPVIRQENGVLWSSAATGNQWYLNGKAIQGAIDNGWTPRDLGSYTVQSTSDGCASQMSDAVAVAGNWKVQTLYALQDTGCVTRFSAIVVTTSGTADSISFEVTAPNSSVTYYKASPSQVINSSATVTAATNQLAPNSSYSVRVKLWFGGAYVYSTPLAFTLNPLTAPVILENSGHQLTSSYSWGNQWYLDGNAIAGASGPVFIPKQSGNYTVQSAEGVCVSPMSTAVKIDVDNQTTPNSYPLGVASYPNPVRDQLTLLNTENRSLLAKIYNFNGLLLYTVTLNGYTTTISTRQLAPGKYIVHLVDLVTGEKKSITFLKL